jgi:hypothetical protein
MSLHSKHDDKKGQDRKMKNDAQLMDISDRAENVFSAWVVCGYCILCLLLASFFLSAPARTPVEVDRIQFQSLAGENPAAQPTNRSFGS